VAQPTQVERISEGEPSVEQLLEQSASLRDADLGRARYLVQQARVLARSNDDRVGEADALYRLAELAYASGQSNDALMLALEARDLAHQSGALLTEVAALNIVAAVQFNSANFSEALLSAVSALDLYRSTGERSSEGLLLNSLALIQHSLGDTDKAIVTYEAALMANKGQDRADLDAITLANMARVRADRNEHLLAVSLGESALTLARDSSPEFVPEILARLAMAYVTLSSLDRAAVCLDEAESVLRDREHRHQALSPAGAVTVRIARGELHLAQHLRDHAIRDWTDAVELATTGSMTDIALELHARLADLYRQMGRFEQALQHQEVRYELNEKMSARAAELRAHTLQLQHDAEVAKYQSALERLRTTELERMVHARATECEQHLAQVFQRVAAFAEGQGGDAARHVRDVGVLSGELALELTADQRFADQVAAAAQFHHHVLEKAGPLDDAEYEQIKMHPEIGRQMLAGSHSPITRMAESIAWCHHERWDGGGYPRGLAGSDIPLAARIVAVADVADALTHRRVYKGSWSDDDVMAHIRDGSGSHFDPEVVLAFERLVERRRG
jgi:HD-GYP domain-containing protein (c-di-GMP phosphodiesterase class II)